jgi:SAM-dependent methyltransferase
VERLRSSYGRGHRPAERPAATPRQRRAFSTLGGPVDLGGEAEAARTLGRLYEVERSLERALTHGFHSYAGRMHPSIARGAVAAFSAPGDAVVDPFCGSGTVPVEAMGLGRRAFGVDASPLGVAIARVRTTLLGEAGRERLVAEAAAIAEQSGERARKRRRPDVPYWATKEVARFHPHVLYELLGLRELVMAHPDDDIGRALRLCLSSLLVKFMKAGPTAPRDGAEKRIARGVPSRMLADRAAELARGLAALARRTPAGTSAPEISEGDARALPMAAGSAQLVLSSPPYAGTYDYAAIHDARFLWLGLSEKKFRRVQLGARTEHVGDVPGAAWRAEQARFMAEVARVLRPGGHALLVVGDGVVDGRAENAPDGIAAAGAAVGLEAVARASQARPLHDRRLAQIFADQPRREHLLLLQKTGR